MPVSVIALLVELPHHLRFVAFIPLAMLLQLVAHEAGHALVAVSRGYRVQTVFVTAPAVGVVSGRPSQDIEPLDLVLVSLGGPVANFLAALLAAPAVVAGGWTPFLAVYAVFQLLGFGASIFPSRGQKAKRAVVVSWPALGLSGAATDGYYAKLMLRGP